MPKEYLAMKRKFMKQGMSEEAAETKAARIYNYRHPDNPVGRNYDSNHETTSGKKKRKKK